MNVIDAARALTGDTLAFHLLLVTFGVGLPVFISLFELIYVIKKDEKYIKIVKTWTRALVILFIAGAVSGMIVSISFSVIWPTFISFASKVVGVSFGLEGYAFLIETLFLVIYIFSFKLFKPLYHWLISLIIVISSSASAFFITSVNAWMNDPTGFKLNSKGQPVSIDTWRAVFNKALPTEFWHSWLAYLFTVGLVLLAVYTWPLLRTKRHQLSEMTKNNRNKLVYILVIITLIVGVVLGFTGDQSAKFIAKNEPYKLAAAEGVVKTQTHAPLIVGGIVHGNSVTHAIKIPGLLSFLATGHTNGTVSGIDSFNKNARPSFVIHYFFDGMVFIGIFTICFLIFYLILRVIFKKGYTNRLIMFGFSFSAILGLCGIEFGWLLTEFGRQPYIIHGVMLVSQASTKSQKVLAMGEIFPCLYLILFALTIYALKKNFKPSKDLQ